MQNIFIKSRLENKSSFQDKIQRYDSMKRIVKYKGYKLTKEILNSYVSICLLSIIFLDKGIKKYK